MTPGMSFFQPTSAPRTSGVGSTAPTMPSGEPTAVLTNVTTAESSVGSAARTDI
jgi:hypothetical protein